MMTPDEPRSPRAAAAGGVSGSSGLRGPQCRIGCGQWQHRSACGNRCKAKVARQDSAGELDRCRDMIAVTPAMMMRIALVVIRRYFVGIAGGVTLCNLVTARLGCADAGVRPFQRVRRRRRSKGADEHQAGKDVQQASHGSILSSNADGGIVAVMVRPNTAIIATLPGPLAALRAMPESLRRELAMPSAGR